MSAILTILGRATRDPEMQQGKNSGTEYVSLDIAVSQRGQDGKEETIYYQCYFNKFLAERLAKAGVKKGTGLMIYGDLDVSVLDELPPGRQPVATFAVSSRKRERAYGYVKKHIDEGRQGYIVCPLVEEGETDLASAEAYAEKLAHGAFAGYRLGLLHGRMKAAEKERVMAAFSAGEISLLVSTTVVEVGVNVPNAVIMVIENAERFGLAQLHQLRGRSKNTGAI